MKRIRSMKPLTKLINNKLTMNQTGSKRLMISSLTKKIIITMIRKPRNKNCA